MVMRQTCTVAFLHKESFILFDSLTLAWDIFLYSICTFVFDTVSSMVKEVLRYRNTRNTSKRPTFKMLFK